jgi:nitrate/nitrite-specific signal transduction histidine kinase
MAGDAAERLLETLENLAEEVAENTSEVRQLRQQLSIFNQIMGKVRKTEGAAAMIRHLLRALAQLG